MEWVTLSKSPLALKKKEGVPIVTQQLVNLMSIHEDSGSLPGLTQWIKDPLPGLAQWIKDPALL